MFYINSRKTKEFRVSPVFFEVLEVIEKHKDLDQIYSKLRTPISYQQFNQVIETLLNNNIIEEIKNKDVLSKLDTQRFSRQLVFFSEILDSEYSAEKTQHDLLNKKICIFGCGAVGSLFAIELARIGIKNFVLIDKAIVEQGNLARHFYFRQNEIGNSKVDALSNYLHDICSNVIVKSHHLELNPNTDLSILIEDSDFVINTMDEPYIGYTSVKIGRYCVENRIAHFIGGGFDAHIASTGELIIPRVTPCVDCYRTHFDEVLKDWKPESHKYIPDTYEIGGTSAHSLFSASFGIKVIMDYLCKLNNNVAKTTRGEFLSDVMDIYFLDVVKNPNCATCGQKHD